MALKIENKITEYGEDWNVHSGDEIQDFLEARIQELTRGKIGAWQIGEIDGGLSELRGFATAQDRDDYLDNPSANAGKILASVQFSTVKADLNIPTFVAKITQQPPSNVATNADCTIGYSYSSYYSADEADNADGKLTVRVNGDVVDELCKTLPRSTGATLGSINVGKYLTRENNTVNIVINNTHGGRREWTFNVRVVKVLISLANTYDCTKPKAGEWALPIKCAGVPAEVSVKLDGEIIAAMTLNNESKNVTIPQKAGGAHTIEVTACAQGFEDVTAIPIVTTYISSKEGKVAPTIVIHPNAKTELPQYGEAHIPYYLYYPGKSNEEVTVSLELSAEGEQIGTATTQKVMLDTNGSSGMQEAIAVAMDDIFSTLVAVTATLKVGSSSIPFGLTIKKSDIVLRPTGECVSHLTASGRTNTDTNANNWADGGISVKRSDREGSLVSVGGFVDGALKVGYGRQVTLDGFKPFEIDRGANAEVVENRTGLTFEMELMISGCTDSTTKVVDCMDDKGIGFAIYADHIELSTIGSKVVTPISDGERLRIGFVIDGHVTDCEAKVPKKDPVISQARIAYIYINGVYARMMDYGKNARWVQEVAKQIVIGSQKAEVNIYSVRVYHKALTSREMIANYAYDTPSLADKLAVAKRNHIYNTSGKVDIALVREALPNTADKVWELASMPQDKSTWVAATTVFTNPTAPANAENAVAARSSYVCAGHKIALDGTSSLNYPDPYKNWANNYEGGAWTVRIGDTDVTIMGYSLSEGIEPNYTEDVDKVNFASSEGIFNMLAMTSWHDLTLKLAEDHPELLTPQQRAQLVEGKKPSECVKFRQSLDGMPIVGYLKDEAGNPQFLSIYNTINNKYDRYLFGMPKDGTSQVWEVEDNINFFSSFIEPGAWTNGAFDSNSTVLYYARVPKSSPTNSGNKFGVAKNETQVATANEETKQLRAFHNWIYSCNPTIAERQKFKTDRYATLPEAVTIGGVTYYQDSPAYRLAKFDLEANGVTVDGVKLKLNKDSACVYFNYFNYVLGMDSFDKNMSIILTKGADDVWTASFAPRDSDTCYQDNNSGQLEFKAFHEWNDTYNKTTDETGSIKGETYDAATGQFSPNIPNGSKPIFNGRLSGLWECVNRAWSGYLSTIYGEMRSAGFTADEMWQRYQGFWSAWCEALYNEDGRGYAATGKFDMAHGDKRQQVKAFLKARQRYMDSKHGAASATALELRLTGTPPADGGIYVKHSAPVYASVKWGANYKPIKRAITPGEAIDFAAPEMVYNDTTVSIFSPDTLTELGVFEGVGDNRAEKGINDLTPGLKMSNLDKCPLLEKVLFEYSQESPNNIADSYMLGACKSKALQVFKVTNCPNVVGNAEFASSQLTHVDLRGTGVTTFSAPATDTLKTLELGASLTELKLADFPNLETLTIQGCSELDYLSIDNCPKTAEAVKAMVPALATAPLGRGMKLLRVNWLNMRTDTLLALAEKKIALGDKMQLTGYAKLSGDQTLSNDQRVKLVEAFGDIVNNDPATAFQIDFTAQRVTLRDFSISGTHDYITKTGKVQMQTVMTPSGANTLESMVWSIDSPDLAEINPITGELNVLYIPGGEAKLTAEVKCVVTLLDGRVISHTRTVHFYAQEPPKFCDIVFHDGTYSSDNDPSKVAIGIVYDIVTLPDGRKMAKVTALDDYGSGTWGSGENIKDSSGNILAYNDTPLNNTDSAGVGALDRNNMWDFSKNSWSLRPENSAATHKGYYYVSEDTEVATTELTYRHTMMFDQNEPGVTPGTNMVVPAGTLMPYGQYQTLRIIGIRNKTLKALGLEVPAKSIANTEMDDMWAKRSANYAYELKLNEAFSCAYAYEPSMPEGRNHELRSEFRAHNWALPAAGELAQIFFWINEAGVADSQCSQLKPHIDSGLFKVPASDAKFWSSSEYSWGFAWAASLLGLSREYKLNLWARVRPVAAFYF